MHHIAIMKKSWDLTSKVLSGQKTIESRWYKSKYTPWDKIKKGETIFFKDSGDPVTIKAKVADFLQFSLTPDKIKEILNKYHKQICIANSPTNYNNKNYCILIFLKDPKKVKPFNINKKGFGNMAAWITVDNVESIKI